MLARNENCPAMVSWTSSGFSARPASDGLLRAVLRRGQHPEFPLPVHEAAQRAADAATAVLSAANG
jgi:hypothetical protein